MRVTETDVVNGTDLRLTSHCVGRESRPLNNLEKDARSERLHVAIVGCDGWNEFHKYL